MQHGGRDLFEISPGGRGLGRTRRHWLGSGALFLLLLSVTACSGTVTGSESAEDLEEREAESSADEEGNRRR